MKLYLFGGAEIDQWQFLPQMKLIEKVIQKINPKQILHIPFARTKTSEPEWAEGWFGRNIDIKWTEYLNANNKEDIDKVDAPLIFISGGTQHANLYEKLTTNPKLLSLVKSANNLIGESAGARILWTYQRVRWTDGNRTIKDGLDIIKDTLLEPHYSERNRQGDLEKSMKETWVSYGIGVDCATAIVFELEEFQKKYEKIGDGVVEVKKV